MDRKSIEKFLSMAQQGFAQHTQVDYRGRNQAPSKVWQKYSSRDLTWNALVVLNTTPVARDAVLQYFSILVQESVKGFISQIENPLGAEYTFLEEASVIVAANLTEWLHSRPDVWISVIFKWSLETLSVVSEQNIGRPAVPDYGKINELLQLFTSCKAAKSVLDLTQKTLGHLLETEPNKCINAVLELSTKYGPSFDWILTCIGTWYPKAMVGRLLDRAQTEFVAHVNELIKKQHMLSITQATQRKDVFNKRLQSLASIIGHLSQHHRGHVVDSLRQIATEGLQCTELKNSTMGIPFLLKLARVSLPLLNIMISGLNDMLTLDNLNCAARVIFQVPQQILLEAQSSLSTLFLNMILALPQLTLCLVFDKLIELAYGPPLSHLEVGDRNFVLSVQKHTREILEHLLSHMQRQVHGQLMFTQLDLPILQEVEKMWSACLFELYSTQTDRARFYLRLLCLVAWMRGSAKTVQVLSWILTTAESEQQLSTFVCFCNLMLPYHPTALKDLLGQINFLQSVSGEKLKEGGSCDDKLINNLHILLLWEKKSSSENKSRQATSDANLLRISDGILHNYATVSAAVLRPRQLTTVLKAVEMLLLVSVPVQLLPSSVMDICYLMADLLFFVMSQEDTDLRLDVCWKLIELMLNMMSSQKLAKEFLIHRLFQNAFERRSSVLSPSSNNTASNVVLDGTSLLKENQSFSFKKISAIVHSGTIGAGKVRSEADIGLPKVVVMNRLIFKNLMELFIFQQSSASSATTKGSVRSGALTFGSSASRANARLLALLLNDFICSDAISAQHAWETWDYTRANLERYLHVARKMKQTNFLWDLLFVIATAQPCLWYCSPILKCIFVWLLSQCEGSANKSASPCEDFLRLLDRFVHLLSEGNLLPQSFRFLPEIAKRVILFEVYSILLDMWQYLMDSCPSRSSLEEQCTAVTFNDLAPKIASKPYEHNLRLVLNANIGALGQFYPVIFNIDSDPVAPESFELSESFHLDTV